MSSSSVRSSGTNALANASRFPSVAKVLSWANFACNAAFVDHRREGDCERFAVFPVHFLTIRAYRSQREVRALVRNRALGEGPVSSLFDGCWDLPRPAHVTHRMDYFMQSRLARR